MPELPEVETIRRVLEPQLQNRTIEKVTVNHKDAVAYPSVDDFCLGLTGQMVSHIQRRGKFLIICMKSGDRVILHLRMTGGLLFTPKNYPEEKYTHLIFHFDQGQKLLFSDMRRFGRFWFLKKEEKDTEENSVSKNGKSRNGNGSCGGTGIGVMYFQSIFCSKNATDRSHF